MDIIDKAYCVHVLQQSLYNSSCHIHVYEHICSLPQPCKMRFVEPIGLPAIRGCAAKETGLTEDDSRIRGSEELSLPLEAKEM